ncbi:hypothetical protein K458DRAFT_407248 [Lentithecium fluviatile CBS 122367]|uniref:Uncharacterized protein n=1 Tax=Lentithecium fluviatile CBS 122367 TaxID=1168545 RepID=A0A6G1IQH5_9PLEO|nr:hypothetical protein K458DRAFT_407248 [Lentithecium fluviatile CBS 122367]
MKVRRPLRHTYGISTSHASLTIVESGKMPSEQSATPGRRRHTSIHITDLPAELLLLIEVFLDSDEDIWSLAFAYPSIPQLMIPILKELEVENHSCESTFLNRNTTNILAFLSEFPSYANEIKGIRYTHSVCQSIVTEKHGCDCMPSPSSTADEEVLVPWRYGWTKKEQNVLKDFAGSSGLSPDPDFMHALTNATGYDLELAKVALLLALGRNIRSLHIGIKSSTWCDLARISDMALLPVLRAQERHLDEVVITKGPAKGYSKPSTTSVDRVPSAIDKTLDPAQAHRKRVSQGRVVDAEYTGPSGIHHHVATSCLPYETLAMRETRDCYRWSTAFITTSTPYGVCASCTLHKI